MDHTATGLLTTLVWSPSCLQPEPILRPVVAPVPAVLQPLLTSRHSQREERPAPSWPLPRPSPVSSLSSPASTLPVPRLPWPLPQIPPLRPQPPCELSLRSPRRLAAMATIPSALRLLRVSSSPSSVELMTRPYRWELPGPSSLFTPTTQMVAIPRTLLVLPPPRPTLELWPQNPPHRPQPPSWLSLRRLRRLVVAMTLSVLNLLTALSSPSSEELTRRTSD